MPPELPDPKELIRTTLNAFKKRVEKNGKERPWTDDLHHEEGLQITCEGLENFLMFEKSYLPDIDRLFTTDELRIEADRIHGLWKQDGFAPKPYPFYELLKQHEEPKEKDFVDTAVHSFTVSARLLEHFSSPGSRNEEIRDKLEQIITSSLEWLVQKHREEGGWSGLSGVTRYATVYATRAVTSVLPLIDQLKERSHSEEIKKLIIRLGECIGQTQKWFFSFAQNQQGSWKESTRGGAQEAIFYNILGLDILLNLKRYCPCEPDTVVLCGALQQVLDTWINYRALYEETEWHYFKTNDHVLKYGDRSIIPLTVYVLSKFAAEYPESHPGLEYKKESGEILSCAVAVSEYLPQITLEMVSSLYDKQRRLWTNNKGKFLIYMTLRVLEALYSYDQYKASTVPVEKKLLDMMQVMSQSIEEIKDTGSNLSKELRGGLDDISKIKASLDELNKKLTDESLADIIGNLVKHWREGDGREK